MTSASIRRYRERATRAGSRVTIPFPFEPAETWGARDRYHLTGTIGGIKVRPVRVRRDGRWLIELGPTSPSAAPLTDGQMVTVELWPEGPQAEQMAPDIAEALAARPRAQAAFDGLATFYRKGWLRWIDATKRRPDVRAERIAEMVRLVESGRKERS